MKWPYILPVAAEDAVAAAQDAAHQMREARASRAATSFYSPDQLAAMRAAVPDAQRIVHDQRNAPTGPASIIPSTARATSVRVT